MIEPIVCKTVRIILYFISGKTDIHLFTLSLHISSNADDVIHVNFAKGEMINVVPEDTEIQIGQGLCFFRISFYF